MFEERHAAKRRESSCHCVWRCASAIQSIRTLRRRDPDCAAPRCLRNHGGSCDARSKLSSSSTAAEPTCAPPRPEPAARRRCGGGSGSPVTRSDTHPSRSWPASRGTRWRSGLSHGMSPFSSDGRHRLCRRKRGGSVASRRRRENSGELRGASGEFCFSLVTRRSALATWVLADR